jgi:type II secretory pathway pseudopilin PulG
MKRLTLLVAAVLAFAAVAATPALAASPHFVGTPSATVSGNTLTVTFKAAGLGNETTVPITLSGDVTVGSRCYTKSGNKPQAANKQETIHVDQTQDFPVRNGQTTGSFTVTPLSTLSCPGGQHVVIESVDYSNLALTGPGGLRFDF